MAAVAVVDVTAGPGVGFLPLVALGPAFAGIVGGWRRTAAIGAVALGLCAVLAWYDGLLDTRRGVTAMASVAGVTAAGLAAAVMRQRREAELATVRSIAEVAQRVLLRPVPRRVGHLSIAVSYTSATAEAHIGGDLYEVIRSPGGVRVIVGDVQGKGLEAVETASVVLGAFREAAHDAPDLAAIGARLERAVQRQGDGEKFVTAVLAEVGPEDGVTLLTFGHPPPLVVRPDGSAAFAEPPAYAPPLGLDDQTPDTARPFEVTLPPGSRLFLYTDGVTEARDGDGRFYPLHERAALLGAGEPGAALDALRTDLLRYVRGPLHDDAAMLLLRHDDRAPADQGPLPPGGRAARHGRIPAAAPGRDR